MKIELSQTEPYRVRLGSLDFGDAFLHPFDNKLSMVVDKNAIDVFSGLEAPFFDQTFIVHLGNSGVGMINSDTLVQPMDAVVTAIEKV